MFIPVLLFSQTKIISGQVLDNNGIPIPSVSVLLKNADIGVVTNLEGEFSVEIPEDSSNILIFTYVGFETKEVNVSNKSVIKVTMTESLTELNEVVLIGYGSINKRDVTGSISSVSVKDEVAVQNSTMDQLLQGRAAGVQVIQNQSSPGAGISVKIRGISSLRGNNEPLYVVDGIIVSSAGEDVAPAGGVGNASLQAQNGLNGINPRDIEDIRVLKDASATAIYGSRGANGVVLITTKKGKIGKPKISSFINTSVRTVNEARYNVLNPIQYANYINESNTINGGEPSFLIEGSNIFRIDNEEDTVSDIPAKTFDWHEDIFKSGFSTKVGANVSGGSERGNYYIAAGFDDQKGLTDNSGFQSGDIRINLNQDLTSKLTLETKASAFFSSSDFSESGDLIGGSNQSFINNVISFRPLITDDIGNNITQDLGLSNPLSFINDYADTSIEKRYFGSMSLFYDLPVKGLKYQLRAGGNIRTKDRRRFFGLTTFNGANANGALEISTLKASTYQVENFLRYNRTFNNKHRINAVFGVTYDVRDVDNSVFAVEDFVTTVFTTEQPAFGQVNSRPLTFFKSDQKVFSLLSRINYSFDNKYILTASVRRDGVSKFSADNRYSTFPSFAFAWNAGKEKFIEDIGFIDDLKFRAGWGQIGNHGIRPFETISQFGVTSLIGNASGGTNVPIALLNVANPDLKWETSEQSNFGLDFVTKNSVFSGSIDVYNKKTKDLLQQSNIPTSSGFSVIRTNRGEITNNGLEVSFNSTPISTGDFEFSFGANISFNKTEITDLSAQPLSDLYINGQAESRRFYFGNNVSRGNVFKYPANIFVEGEEIGVFYGFKTDGIYQTDDEGIGSNVFGSPAVAGDVKIVDLNNDGEIDINDRTIIGNPNPDFFYGFNLNARYKNLSIRALFNGVYGNDIANGNLLSLDNAEGINRNILEPAFTNAWRPDNASNTHPRIGYTTSGQPGMTDRIIEDGSYLRLNNVTISYDVPLKNKNIFNSVNIYIAGQNLITWTDYSGYDPELTSFLFTGLITGVDWNGPPNARNFTLGLNLNF